MEMDKSLRPTYHKYDFRSDMDLTHTQPLTEIQGAQTSDEILIAAINREAKISDMKLKQGEAKAAVQVLRRAHRVAEASSGPAGELPRPAAHCALAIVHLHLCTVLSKLGRHQQALDEARSGCQCVDQLWRALSFTRNAAESADFESMSMQTRKALQSVLVDPPAWLEEAVAVTVQVRQAYASEAEMTEDNGLTFEFHHRGIYRREMSNVGPLCSTDFIDPKTPKTTGTDMWHPKEVDKLHAQSVSLARTLVPGSPVHVASEALKQKVDLRRGNSMSPTSFQSTGTYPSRSFGMSTGSFSIKDQGIASILSRSAKARLPIVERVDGEPLVTPKQKCLARSASASTALGSSNASGRSQKDWGHASNDFGRMTTPQSPASPGGSKQNPKELKTKKSLKDIQKEIDQKALEDERRKKEERKAKEQALREAEAKKANPFDVWKKTMTDVNRMSYKQMLNRSDAGQHELTEDIKNEGRLFKAVKMPTLENDFLYETRVYTSGHGEAAQKRSEAHKQRVRAIMYPMPESEKRLLAQEKEQFDRFGVEIIKTGPGQLRNMNKVYRLAYEKSPHGQMEQEAIREEKRRKVEEEKGREKAKLMENMQAMKAGPATDPKPEQADAEEKEEAEDAS